MKSQLPQAMEAFVHEGTTSYAAYFIRVRKRFEKEGPVPFGLLEIAERMVRATPVERNMRSFFAGAALSCRNETLSATSLKALGRSVLLFSTYIEISNRLLAHRSRDVLWREMMRFVPSHIPVSRRFHTAEGFAMVLADIVLALAFEQVNESRLSAPHVVALSAFLASAVADMGMQKTLSNREMPAQQQKVLFFEWGMHAVKVEAHDQREILRALRVKGARRALSRSDVALLQKARLFHNA